MACCRQPSVAKSVGSDLWTQTMATAPYLTRKTQHSTDYNNIPSYLFNDKTFFGRSRIWCGAFRPIQSTGLQNVDIYRQYIYYETNPRYSFQSGETQKHCKQKRRLSEVNFSVYWKHRYILTDKTEWGVTGELHQWVAQQTQSTTRWNTPIHKELSPCSRNTIAFQTLRTSVLFSS